MSVVRTLFSFGRPAMKMPAFKCIYTNVGGLGTCVCVFVFRLTCPTFMVQVAKFCFLFSWNCMPPFAIRHWLAQRHTTTHTHIRGSFVSESTKYIAFGSRTFSPLAGIVRQWSVGKRRGKRLHRFHAWLHAAGKKQTSQQRSQPTLANNNRTSGQ